MTKTYDEQIAWGQDIREQVVDTVMVKGLDQASKEDLDILLKAAKDHTSTAIAAKRTQIEQEGSATNKELLATLSKFVVDLKGGCPFEVPITGTVVPTRKPVELEDLGQFDMVPGEGHIGTVTTTSAEFREAFDEVRRERGEID